MFEGHKSYGRWVPPSFLFNSGTTWQNYVVPPQFEGRPDSISQDIYGTVIYWWVLVAFNSPRDTLNWPTSGDTIKAPFIQDIIAVL